MQVQTVRGQIVSQRDLRWTQCKKEMNSRIHSQVVVARLCRSFCSAKAECLQAHAHMQVHEGDKLKVIRFPRSSTVVTTPTSTSVTSADVNTVFSGFAVHLHSRSLPVKTTSTERAADAPRNRVSEQAAGIKCGVLDWHCVTNHFLVVREGDITQSRAKSLVLRKLQLRQSCRWNVTVFAENVSDSITQVRCKVQLTLGSRDRSRPCLGNVREGNKLEVVRFPGLVQQFQLQQQISNFGWRQHVDFGFAVHLHSDVRCPGKTRKPGQRSGVWHQCGVLESHCVANLVLTVREDDITQSRANPWSLAYFNSVTLFNHAESRITCR